MSDSWRDPEPEELDAFLIDEPDPAIWKNYPKTSREVVVDLIDGIRHYIYRWDDDPRIVWTWCNKRFTYNITQHPEGHLKVLPDCYCQNKKRMNCENCFQASSY